MCFISRKRYDALNGLIESQKKDLQKSRKDYSALLDKYDSALKDNQLLLCTIETLKEEIRKLTPVRDSKGRFTKRS